MRSASATLPASSPPDSMNGTPGSRSSSRRQSKACRGRRAASRSRGGVASNSSRSATLVVERGPARDRRASAIGIAFITGRPKRARTATTRSGVSLPCSCSMSGLSASTMRVERGVVGIDRERDLAGAAARAAPSARAASSPRWRGDGGKNTKPTMSAPASSAASSASGGLQAADFDRCSAHNGRVLAPSPAPPQSGTRPSGERRRNGGRRVGRCRLHRLRASMRRPRCSSRTSSSSARAPRRHLPCRPGGGAADHHADDQQAKISTNSGRRHRIGRARRTRTDRTTPSPSAGWPPRRRR